MKGCWKKRWISILSIALLVTSGVLSACSAPKTRLKIVTSFPMRGIAAGSSIVDAVELALSETDWQIGNVSLELVKLDDGNEMGQWDAELERANVEQAVRDPSVIAYIGPFNSGAAKISIPIASPEGLLQISPSATWPGLTKVGFAPGEPAKFYPTGQRTFYRTCPTDDVQAPAAVRWAKALGFRTVYVIEDGEAYGKGLADLFEQNALAAGLRIIGRETIDKTATDFIVTISNLRLWKPDLVYFGGYTANGVIPLLTQMRTAKPVITSAFMGADAIVDTAFVKGVGEYSEGVYATLVGVPPSELQETGKTFFEAYQAKYGRPPEAFANYGYDAAQAVLAALREARTKNRAGVLKAMADKLEFTGASEFSFDSNGDTTLISISGMQVQDGQFKFVQLLDIR